MRKHFLRLFLSACLISLLPGQTLAWDAKGHRIIAALAWDQLDQPTRAAVKELLGDKSVPDPLTAVATWADDQRVKSPTTNKWHFVSIPAGAFGYDPTRDCPNNDCLVERINIYRHKLQYSTNRNERIEALKYLVHLVGDLHQPLHCFENGDYGGNKFSVTFFGQSTNLHRVWDGDIINWTGMNETNYVAKLNKSRLPTAQSWVTEWVNESYALAPITYNTGAGGKLGITYYKTMLPKVDMQLARGGVRLAFVLGFALGVKK